MLTLLSIVVKLQQRKTIIGKSNEIIKYVGTRIKAKKCQFIKLSRRFIERNSPTKFAIDINHQ